MKVSTKILNVTEESRVEVEIEQLTGDNWCCTCCIYFLLLLLLLKKVELPTSELHLFLFSSSGFTLL